MNIIESSQLCVCVAFSSHTSNTKFNELCYLYRKHLFEVSHTITPINMQCANKCNMLLKCMHVFTKTRLRSFLKTPIVQKQSRHRIRWSIHRNIAHYLFNYRAKLIKYTLSLSDCTIDHYKFTSHTSILTGMSLNKLRQ